MEQEINQDIGLNAGEFLRGQRDCRDGEGHMDGQGKAYDRGYSAQYELEQASSNLNGGIRETF